MLVENGVEVINERMYSHSIEKMEKGINGGTWIYFKDGGVTCDLKLKLGLIKHKGIK